MRFHPLKKFRLYCSTLQHHVVRHEWVKTQSACDSPGTLHDIQRSDLEVPVKWNDTIGDNANWCCRSRRNVCETRGFSSANINSRQISSAKKHSLSRARRYLRILVRGDWASRASWSVEQCKIHGVSQSLTRVKRISFSTTLRQARLNDLLKLIEPRHQLARSF